MALDAARDAGRRIDEDGDELMGERVRQKRRASRGYSLIELLVVVAMVGIVAVITVPALLQLMPQYRIRSAASETAAAIRMIRSQAIAQRTPWRIDFDLANNRYRYWRLTNPNAELSVAANWTAMRRNPRWVATTAAEEWVQVTAVQLDAAANSLQDVVCPVNPSNQEVDLIFLRNGAISPQGRCTVSPPSTPLTFSPEPELKFSVDSNMVRFNRYYVSIAQNGIVRVRAAKE